MIDCAESANVTNQCLFSSSLIYFFPSFLHKKEINYVHVNPCVISGERFLKPRTHGYLIASIPQFYTHKNELLTQLKRTSNINMI